MSVWTRIRHGLAGLLAFICASALVAPAGAQDAAALLARHTALREQLENTAFHRPLHLESSEASGHLTGEIYAVIERPYGMVGAALQNMDAWCDILMLHTTVKDCWKSNAGGTDMLAAMITRRYDQPPEDGHRVDFAYKVSAADAGYLQVVLKAKSGPLGTKNYRIMLEAAPLDAERSFVHLSYSYASGIPARIAMQLYLATSGRNKVGFTVVGQREDGQPIHIDGFRGVMERNAMRYFLAIEAYLGALNVPPSQRLEYRLRNWHAAIYRYPVQLHDVERDEYLEMKRREEKRRQQSAADSSRMH